MNKIDLYIPKIRQNNILSSLSESEIKELLEFALFHETEENEVIFRENDFGTSIYMIISGTVKICKTTENGAEYEITRLGESEFFGEMSFLDNSVRSANAVSAAKSILISLDEERFKRFSHRYSYAAFRFLKNISIESQKRIRQTNEKLLLNYEALLKTHNELAENRNFLYNVIRSSSEIIIILDANQKILIFNSGAENNLQVAAINAVARTPAPFFCDGDYQNITSELMRGVNIYNRDVYLRCADGRKILTNFSAFTIKNTGQKENTLQALVIIASNITHKKLLERQLLQNEKMIFLGKIISEIVHEIKNPLTVINLAKDCLRQICAALNNGEAEKNLTLIENASANIHATILNTLNFAKVVPAGHNKLDLNSVAANSIEWCRRNTKLKNIDILFNRCNEKVEITGNESQLEQALINILTNAVNSIPPGKNGLIKVSIGLSKTLVFCTIEDNGCGMDEEVVNNIFEPFFTTRQQSGASGLGLSICQAIISQHNGSLNCRSKLNEGSVFIINFNRAA